MLDNLIDNALRYAPAGSEVRVETGGARRPRDARRRRRRARASRRRSAARVFERFYRGSTGRSAGPGTGLGLAIVAELVRRWDGEVRLLDAPGTRVEAVFPRAPAES